MFRLVDCLEMAQPQKLSLPGCSGLWIPVWRQPCPCPRRVGGLPWWFQLLGLPEMFCHPWKVRVALTPLQLGMGAVGRRKCSPPWAASAAIVLTKYWSLGAQKPLQRSQALCLCRLTTTLNFFVNKTEGMWDCQNANSLLHTVIFSCEV